MKNVLLILFITPMFFACKSDSAYDTENLYGRWELSSASRADDKTEMLAGTFFEFAKDGSMRTNLPEVASSSKFSVAKNLITNSENSSETYQIKYLDPDQLVLETFLQDVRFRLEFNRGSRFGNE